METAGDAARHCHEEQREEVWFQAAPIVKTQLSKRKLFQENVEEKQNGCENEKGADEGVNLADDLVYWEQRGDEVVGEYDAINNPEPGIGYCNVLMDYSLDENVARRIDAGHAEQKHSQADEDAEKQGHVLAEVAFHQALDLFAVVPDGDHAGHEVLHGSRQYAAQRDRDEGQRPEEDALYGSEDRARSGDVQ